MKTTSLHPLRIVRCQNNLTTVRLAEEAKVGASTIWRAEHSYAVNAESRRRLCEYFGLTSQELGLLNPLRKSSGELENRPEQFDEQLYPVTRKEGSSITPDSPMDAPDKAGTWLLSEAKQIATLFDASWTLDTALETLRIVLLSMQDMPSEIRQCLLQSGMTINTKHITEEKRRQLTDALDKSIKHSWQIFHTSSPRHVTILGHALLQMVQQTHTFLQPDSRHGFYSTIYNLIGSGFYFQNEYEAARQAHTNAYRAALEGHDIWNQAQSLNWQAIISNAYGHHREAIYYIEDALSLLKEKNEAEHLRLRGHLLANWAYNASMLGEQSSVAENLEASGIFTEHLDPNEEFDLVRWHQMAGECMVINQQYTQAIHHLNQSLEQLPPQWLERRILTLIPLAKAYAHKRERDASIAVAKQAVTAIDTVSSVMLQQRFAEYLHILHDAFPHDKQVSEFVTSIK